MVKTEFHELNVTSWEDRRNSSLGLPYSSCHEYIQYVIKTYVTTILCIFGILGNVVNLIVLTRVRFYKAASRNERGANTGLVALAISDMLFCFAVLPVAFTDHGQAVFPEKSFLLYYQVYGTGAVTTFILTSTWITVTLAVLRYVTICHPVASVTFYIPKSVRYVYFCVSIVACVTNLPEYFQYQITEVGYTGNRTLYFIDIGIMDSKSELSKAFQWIKFTAFIALPAVIILFCNCSLVYALHASNQVRQQYHVTKQPLRRQNRITLILVIIALGFIVLVFPSELMDFFMDFVRLDQRRTEIFLTFRDLANTLQMINFSCNFLLYCALNVHFRTVLKDLVTCQLRRVNHPARKSFRSFQDGKLIEQFTSQNTRQVSLRSLRSHRNSTAV